LKAVSDSESYSLPEEETLSNLGAILSFSLSEFQEPKQRNNLAFQNAGTVHHTKSKNTCSADVAPHIKYTSMKTPLLRRSELHSLQTTTSFYIMKPSGVLSSLRTKRNQLKFCNYHHVYIGTTVTINVTAGAYYFNVCKNFAL
jgi:hypothetical protein